jgi:hypothetical protein
MTLRARLLGLLLFPIAWLINGARASACHPAPDHDAQ